jgi:hypothetical protein
MARYANRCFLRPPRSPMTDVSTRTIKRPSVWTTAFRDVVGRPGHLVRNRSTPVGAHTRHDGPAFRVQGGRFPCRMWRRMRP